MMTQRQHDEWKLFLEMTQRQHDEWLKKQEPYQSNSKETKVEVPEEKILMVPVPESQLQKVYQLLGGTHFLVPENTDMDYIRPKSSKVKSKKRSSRKEQVTPPQGINTRISEVDKM